MDEKRFWKLIEKIDREQMGDDDDGALAPLVSALAAEREDDIRSFEDHLARVLYRLDGERFADEAGDSGDSDDGFLYARCWVVAQGRKHYEATVADPTRMPKSLEQWFESLIYVAANAWEQKTGDEWEHQPPVSWETGSNQAQWPGAE